MNKLAPFVTIMSIAFLIIGLVIGCVLCYFVLQPKIKHTNEINSNIERENNNLQDQKEKLQTNIMDLQKQPEKCGKNPRRKEIFDMIS